MNLYEKLEIFVTNFCKDRDESHGASHMKLVANRSLEICQELNTSKWTQDAVCIVAWLHDVLDSKYNPTKTQYANVKQFIKSLEWDSDTVLKATESISYTKEKNNGMRYFEKILDKNWVLVRDIVSDADKEDGIGLKGINRCYIYEKHMNPEADNNTLTTIVKNHITDRLLKLYPDKFFVTIPGNTKAKTLQKEMIEWYDTH
jgi:HD superfamily phosphodiesterase